MTKKAIHKSPRVQELEDADEKSTVIDALKELTKQQAELTKTVQSMKEVHDKWVRAGKF
jgi:hypothetical protein